MVQVKTWGKTKRALSFMQKRAIDIIMLVVAVFWLIPTVGLFVQSLRTGADIGQSGWWTALPTKHSDAQLVHPPVERTHHARSEEHVYHYHPAQSFVVGIAALPPML